MVVVQIPMPARKGCPDGHVAEWLRNGLQNRVPRFNSGRGLQPCKRGAAKAAAPKPVFRRRRVYRLGSAGQPR